MKKIILIACSILAGCSSPNRSLEQALKQAIAFEAEPKQIKKVFSEFAEIGQEERTSSMYHLLGSNNLSSFLLTCPLDQLSDYMIDFAFDPVKVSPVKVSRNFVGSVPKICLVWQLDRLRSFRRSLNP